MTKLGDIATIKTGYNFNRHSHAFNEQNNNEENKVKIVLPKDISTISKLNEAELSETPLTVQKDEYYLKAEDILFVGKGNFNVALISQPIKAIPSSSFYKIKVTDKNFTSEYVYNFLKFNLDILSKNSRQSTERISSLTLTELSNIDIPCIPLEKQLQLKRVVDYQQKELEILEKLQHNLNILTKGIFTKTIKEHING